MIYFGYCGAVHKLRNAGQYMQDREKTLSYHY